MKMLKSAIFVIKNSKINMSKVKIIIKLEISLNLQGNIEALRIAYVIQNIVCLKKVL